MKKLIEEVKDLDEATLKVGFPWSSLVAQQVKDPAVVTAVAQL